MTLRDLVSISLHNLWRTKLRTALTVAGVVIAISTFVAMLSFAAGNQQYFTTAFQEFGLLNQMNVRPKIPSPADTTEAPILDDQAVEQLGAIPGVRLAYPFSSLTVTASILDTVVTTSARSLPGDAVRTQLFTKVLGGTQFSSESAREAIVTYEFVELLGVDPSALPGQTLILSRTLASLDSALATVVMDPLGEAQALFLSLDSDSILSPQYQRRVVQDQLSKHLRDFFDGLMNRKATVSDTLTIIGTAPEDQKYPFRTEPIVITSATARRLSTGGIPIDGNPAELLQLVKDGSLFEPSAEFDARSYPRVTLELDPLANHKTVKDSVVALGYRASSFAEQFAEMQRFMVYFYLGMSVVGLIALVTASLGIINTLVMSVTERRREIGILKSLGADESHIRTFFLVESAVIGFVGAVLGIALGWAGTRVVAQIGKVIMAREDMPIFDPFTLPLWLIALAMVFGILVSLLAGLYPAARAARVDPVEALRSE